MPKEVSHALLGECSLQEQLRFAVLVQHFASQDTLDFQRSRAQRMHDDSFEGASACLRVALLALTALTGLRDQTEVSLRRG